MAQLQKIIKVTQEQYDTLKAGGTVGSYVGINPDFVYLVEERGEPVHSVKTEHSVANLVKTYFNVSGGINDNSDTSRGYIPIASIPMFPSSSNSQSIRASAHISGVIGSWGQYAQAYIDLHITGLSTSDTLPFSVSGKVEALNGSGTGNLDHTNVGKNLDLLIIPQPSQQRIYIYLFAGANFTGNGFFFNLTVELSGSDTDLMYNNFYVNNIGIDEYGLNRIGITANSAWYLIHKQNGNPALIDVDITNSSHSSLLGYVNVDLIVPARRTLTGNYSGGVLTLFI